MVKRKWIVVKYNTFAIKVADPTENGFQCVTEVVVEKRKSKTGSYPDGDVPNPGRHVVLLSTDMSEVLALSEALRSDDLSTKAALKMTLIMDQKAHLCWDLVNSRPYVRVYY